MIAACVIFAAQLLKWNLVVTAAAAAALLASQITTLGKIFSHSARQRLARLFVVMIICAPFFSSFINRAVEPSNIFEPPVQIAAAKDGQLNELAFRSSNHKLASFRESQSLGTLSSKTIVVLSLALIFLTLGTFAKRIRIILRDRRKLRALSLRSFVIRRIGKIKIKLSDQTTVPFAARDRGECLVILPQSLIARPNDMKISIAHELQHHRQNDLVWNWLLEIVRFSAGWNPLINLWLERIEQLDELACDENLLGRGRIDVRTYATCLFQAALAISTLEDEVRLVGTAGMATSSQFLRRRIEMTLQPRTQIQKGFFSAAVIAITGLTTIAVWASDGVVKDRRVTQAQAETLVKIAQPKAGIPIVLNKRVLTYLNLATGSPRSRFYMRNALKRMELFKPVVEGKLTAAHLPLGLLALPAMESGYQNTETLTSAGIWQFVPETGRKYGLQVDDIRDERLDAARETDAAVSYLSYLNTLFSNDWSLALLSYNAGERVVQDVIKKTGERDVYKLADEGRLANEENANYVPKFMAALIILNNPSLVSE